jgi:hypothetical protein
MPALAGECIIRRRTSEQARRRKLTTYYRDADRSNQARRAFGYVAAPSESYAGAAVLRGRASTMKALSIATVTLVLLSVSGADAKIRASKLIMCDDPVVRDSLGMCADLSHETADNEREREWIELSAKVQASPKMRDVYVCMDRVIDQQAMHHNDPHWANTAPAMAVRDCNAVNQFQRSAHVSRSAAGRFLCFEAYELLQHYTGRALNPLFIPQMAGVCAMDYR